MKDTYEIIDPKDVGLDYGSIVLTARSGRAALKHRLITLGVEPDAEMLNEAYDKFLKLADSKVDITDDQILNLVGITRENSKSVKLDYLKVVSGKGVQNEAIVRLVINGETHEATSTGNGPVDAAIKAVKSIIMRKMTINEFLIQAMNKGSDDTGKVHMQVEYEGNMYYGFSANTDIVTASVSAFIDAVNKFI
jgi:2-isopropylmalate synthase